jgi:hypothetical protein
MDPDTPVRVRIEQISSVEHAIVVGFPVTATAASDGAPAVARSLAPSAHLTAGHGRPLILTVLEPDEAMRILAGGDARRTRLAAGLLGLGGVLLLAGIAWAIATVLLPAVITLVPGLADLGLVPTAFAASAEPTPVVGGDPRSNGQGPGLVGTPGLAILGVAVIAILAIVATTAYVRLTEPPKEPGRRPRR